MDNHNSEEIQEQVKQHLIQVKYPTAELQVIFLNRYC